jgi:hypothetical protein
MGLSALPLRDAYKAFKAATPSGLEAAGFKASRGTQGNTSDELFSSIKDNIEKEKQNFGAFKDKISNTQIPIEKVQELVNGMQAAQSELGKSDAAVAIGKHVDKYVKELQSLKAPTFEQVDQLAKDFKDDVTGVVKPFDIKYDQTKAFDIGNQWKDTLESSLPPELAVEYKNVKGSYATMAEARSELANAAKGSTDQIIQKITNGDKIDAIERLADPGKFDAALRSYWKAKFPNDRGQMLSKYMETIQKIDNLNPTFSDSMFNPDKLTFPPPTNKGVAIGAAAGMPQTVASEAHIANNKLDEKREKGLDKVK